MKPKGRMLACAICGKKHRSTGRHVRTLTEPTEYPTDPTGYTPGTTTIDAGQHVCTYHVSSKLLALFQRPVPPAYRNA